MIVIYDWTSAVLSSALRPGGLFFFFFSSRRRHTRSDRDWSSDVCSSDLFDGDVTSTGARYLLPPQVDLAVEVTSPSNSANDREPGQLRVKSTKWGGYAATEIGRASCRERV